MKPNLPLFIGKLLLLLGCCFTITSHSFSQAITFGDPDKTRWEIGFNFGPSFFLGDLGGNQGKGTAFVKDLNFEFTKLSKGIYVTMYPNTWLGFRAAANYTFLEGDDAVINTNGIDELHRKQRNLNFRSNVWEAYGAIEFFPLQFIGRNNEYPARLRPYVFGGLGIFHFNPQGSLKGTNGNKTWYNLQPLRTEGQGMAEYPNSKEYKLTQMNIPVGAGIKYIISDRVNFSTEFHYRKTFTDNIDDVSKTYIDANNFIKYMSPQNASLATQLSDKTIPIIYPGMTRFAPGTLRGDTKDADTYFTIVAKIGIQLGTMYSSSGNRRAAKQTRCPAVY